MIDGVSHAILIILAHNNGSNDNYNNNNVMQRNDNNPKKKNYNITTQSNITVCTYMIRVLYGTYPLVSSQINSNEWSKAPQPC